MASLRRHLRFVQSLHLLSRVIAVFVVACAAVSAAPRTPPRLQSSLPVVSGQTFTAVIDPRAEYFPNSWTPSREDVLFAEPQVQACVLRTRRRLRSTLPLYVRHYSGWTFNGRRTLHVQFFDSRHFDHLAEPSLVVDGDDETYFVVSFDTASGICSF